MKIRTLKSRVNKMLNWYAEQVTQNFMGMGDPRTPAGLEMATRALTDVQRQKIALEPNSVEWKFPVEVWVDFDQMRAPNIRVKVKEDWERENLLYLDFDAHQQ